MAKHTTYSIAYPVHYPLVLRRVINCTLSCAMACTLSILCIASSLGMTGPLLINHPNTMGKLIHIANNKDEGEELIWGTVILMWYILSISTAFICYEKKIKLESPKLNGAYNYIYCNCIWAWSISTFLHVALAHPTFPGRLVNQYPVLVLRLFLV